MTFLLGVDKEIKCGIWVNLCWLLTSSGATLHWKDPLCSTLRSSALLWLDLTRFLSAVVWWLCCGRGSVETNKDYLRDQESVGVTTSSKLSRGGLLIGSLLWPALSVSLCSVSASNDPSCHVGNIRVEIEDGTFSFLSSLSLFLLPTSDFQSHYTLKTNGTIK